jgi:[acyl-carrier-protein] S-malonyltransferase
LRLYLDKVSLSSPRIALVNNVDVEIESNPAAIKDALVRQAYSPVRWVETIKRMVESGVTHVVECGPGKVLAGMTRRISPEIQSLTLADRASLEQALQAVKGG